MQTKDQPGLEVFGPHSGLEPVQPGLEQHHQQYRPFPDAQGHYPANSQSTEKPPRSSSRQGGGTICGLRKPTFWLALALATVIVIAAAVGGGVGATQAGKSSSTGEPVESLVSCTCHDQGRAEKMLTEGTQAL